jgi:nitrite reductase/ring-hydroxylating ferredoxin subunit
LPELPAAKRPVPGPFAAESSPPPEDVATALHGCSRRFGGRIERIAMPSLVRVASLAEIPPGTAKEVLAGDRVVALFNVDGAIFAMDGICPHAGGPLGEGELQGTIVTCPWHGWQFDVTSGRHCLSAHIQQSTWVTRIAGDDVFVELPGP